MSKQFRDWTPEQILMLPPSVQDWVPAGHLVHFVLHIVREELDLKPILKKYDEERGYPPFHPKMMVALLLYAYSQGIYSSRRIAKACRERMDFIALLAMQCPDFRTISLFRLRHLEELKGLFGQVLKLCRKAGLATLGHVAVDGTKMRANASKKKSMRYGEMENREQELKRAIDEWFDKAAAIDKEEDGLYGEDRQGDEMPEWVKDKQQRLERIRQAKAELEAEAKAAAEGPRDPSRTRHDAKPTGKPNKKAQRNFTDPESQIMKSADGFMQAYNCQAAVDADNQIIVAQHIATNGSDTHELGSLLKEIRLHGHGQAKEISADSAYCSEYNLKQLRRRHIRGYVASRWQKDSRHNQSDRKPPTTVGKYVRQMWQRLRRGGHRSRYRLRKQVVEPVFGHIKQARGFRQFLLRGKNKVSAEWSLLCTVHNLLKLAAAQC